MLSIIVLSSDGYSDCWNPLFHLFKKNFDKINDAEIILSTNSKDYSYEGLNINVLKHGSETSWSKRVRLSLEKAKNDIVFVLVEDFFLTKKLNQEVFDNVLQQIKENTSIDHVRLLLTRTRTKTTSSSFEFLDVIEEKASLRFTYLPGLWKKNVLLKYVKDYETPYLSERIGDYRSYILKHGFYTISNSFVEENGELYDCPTSGAIFKGKWANWVPVFLEKENISGIDYSIRGFADKEFRKTIRIKNKLNLLKDPINTFRSFLSVIKLYIIRK